MISNMSNRIFNQRRNISFLREVVFRSRVKWGAIKNNMSSPQKPHKKYENRLLNNTTIESNNTHKVTKKYEQRDDCDINYYEQQNISYPSKPIKKYEQHDDDWDINYIRKNGGL